jgi:hypothetical protein
MTWTTRKTRRLFSLGKGEVESSILSCSTTNLLKSFRYGNRHNAQLRTLAQNGAGTCRFESWKMRGICSASVHATALHLAQLLLTLGRALTAAGTALYNLTPKGYRQPPRCAWDHDNPNWSTGFYEALGRQEWERRRRR